MNDSDILIGWLKNLNAWFIEHALVIILLLATGLVINIMLHRLSKQMMAHLKRSQDGTLPERVARARTITKLVFTTARVVLWTIILLLVADNMGINIGPLLASAGIVGLAVSFGSQELVKDIIAGFFILLEGQFNIGDIVELQGKKGKVTYLTLRSVTITDLKTNDTYLVRNSLIGVVTKFADNEKKKVEHAILHPEKKPS